MQSMNTLHFGSGFPVVLTPCRGCRPATLAFDGIGSTGVLDMKKVKPSQLAANNRVKGPQKASNTSSGFSLVLSRVLRQEHEQECAAVIIASIRLESAAQQQGLFSRSAGQYNLLPIDRVCSSWCTPYIVRRPSISDRSCYSAEIGALSGVCHAMMSGWWPGQEMSQFCVGWPKRETHQPHRHEGPGVFEIKQWQSTCVVRDWWCCRKKVACTPMHVPLRAMLLYNECKDTAWLFFEITPSRRTNRQGQLGRRW